MARWSWLAPLTFVVALGAWVAVDAGTPQPVQSQTPACEPQAEVEGRASPYDSMTFTVGDGIAKVCYSRPSLRGRTMIGGDAVPYGQVWRTGANEPTTIHLTVPASIAGIDVDAGSYSLYTIPEEGQEWTLIVNASTSQWGHESTYPGVQDQDVGRAAVQAERLEEAVESFTIRAMDGATGIVLEWQNSRVHVPISAG